MAIDTLNKYMVAVGGRGIALLRPPLPGQTMTADDALILAAYLVALAEHEASHEFAEVLTAVQNA